MNERRFRPVVEKFLLGCIIAVGVIEIALAVRWWLA